MDATTQTGAAAAPLDQADHFGALYDAGAFDANGEPPRDGATQGDDGANAAAQTGSEESSNTQRATTTQQGQEGAENAPAWTSVDDFIGKHNVDPEQFRSLPVTVKIDGQEKQVPLSDVIKSYQLEGHVNNKSIDLSNQRTAFEREQQNVRAQLQQQLAQSNELYQAARASLAHEYQRVDWATLRATNPAEFAALQAEFGQRQNQIDAFIGQIQQRQAAEIQQQQASQQQLMAAERDKLFNARPQWRDESAFAKDRDVMVKYAESMGMKAAEIGAIADHRVMLMLHDAAQFRALQAAAPQAVKQVRQAPVVAKPGSRGDTTPQDANRQAAFERFRRNPRDQDAAAAAFDFLA